MLQVSPAEGVYLLGFRGRRVPSADATAVMEKEGDWRRRNSEGVRHENDVVECVNEVRVVKWRGVCEKG